MKRKFLAILLCALLCVSLCALAACNGNCKHKNVDWIVDKQATCTETGLRHSVCKKCGETVATEVLEKIPHVEVSTGGTPATCTEPGQSAEVSCSACHAVIRESAVIPALGHDYDATGVCTRCGNNAFAFTLAENGTYRISQLLDDSYENVVIPQKHRDVSVTEIADGVFAQNDKILSVVTGDVLQIIGKNAFMGCENLQSVQIGANVTQVSDRAFWGCKRMEELTFASTAGKPQAIGGYAFAQTGVREVVFNVYVSSLGSGAFQDCLQLRKVAFNLNNSQIQYLPNFAFAGCSALYDLTLPRSLRGIALGTFLGCSSLRVLTLPENLSYVGSQAFCDCDLQTVTIPAGVVDIGLSGCFSGNAGLKSITVDPANTVYKSVDGNLYSADGKVLLQYAVGKPETIFTLPETVETIAEGAFQKSILQSVVLPASLKTICDSAFCQSENLAEIVLPSGVTSIGFQAFLSCLKLQSVYVPASVVEIKAGAFLDCSAQILCERAESNLPQDWAEGCFGNCQVSYEQTLD